MTKADALTRETAHFSQSDRDLVARRLVVAIELALAWPQAPEQAITLKLLSLGDCPRWVCELLARAALELAPARALAAWRFRLRQSSRGAILRE